MNPLLPEQNNPASPAESLKNPGGTQQGALVSLTNDYCLTGIRVKWNTHRVSSEYQKSNRKELPK
jgi:hypothetical protein